MDNLNEKVLENLRTKIAVSHFAKEETKVKDNSKNKIFKSVAVASLILVSSTGLVFAKEIEQYIVQKFNLRTMHQVTVDNGYIATSEMDYLEIDAGVQIGEDAEIVDNVKTKLKISDFMLTDDLFDFQVEMQFDEKINQYKDLNKRINGNIDYENFGSIELRNFNVVDEGSNVLVDSKTLVYGSPDTIIPEENKLEDIVFSLSADYAYDDFEKETIKYPNSKVLSISFSDITFVPKRNIGEEIHLIGDWKIDLDIPEIMQNREDLEYKVVNCSNEDFNIVSAIADETGFELRLSINNVKDIPYPDELIKAEEKYKQEHDGRIHRTLTEEGLLEFFGNQELVDLYVQYNKDRNFINIRGEKLYYWEDETKGSYIVDSNGKEFRGITSGTTFNFKYETTYDENGFSNSKNLDIYEGSIIFEMTKFDCTDKLTVYVEFKGEPVKIELERIK